MKSYTVIIVFCLLAAGAYAQRGDNHGKICTQPNAAVAKKDYKRFRKTSCDLQKYPDSKHAKRLVCQAAYFTSVSAYCYALEALKNAYAKSSSEKLRFKVLQMTAENYRLSGDTSHARIYHEKVNRILIEKPDIDK